MIISIRITEIDAKRNKFDVSIPGFEVLFNVEDVKVENDLVKVKYVYTANYRDDIGYISLKGELVAKEDAETIKKISDNLKEKRLPTDYMEKLVNTINYFGTTNATLVATALGVVPPIKTPTLRITPPASAPMEPVKK